MPVVCRRPRGTTLLGDAGPPALPTRLRRGRFYVSPGPCVRCAFFRQLRVIFAPDNTPGLAPSPGRCRLCSELLVPSTPCGADQSARARVSGSTRYRGHGAWKVVSLQVGAYPRRTFHRSSRGGATDGSKHGRQAGQQDGRRREASDELRRQEVLVHRLVGRGTPTGQEQAPRQEVLAHRLGAQGLRSDEDRAAAQEGGKEGSGEEDCGEEGCSRPEGACEEGGQEGTSGEEVDRDEACRAHEEVRRCPRDGGEEGAGEEGPCEEGAGEEGPCEEGP